MNDSHTKLLSRPAAAMIFTAAVILAVILRQAVSAGLPLYIRESYFDDRLMLRMTEGLISGKWLGPYDSGTLMKGAFFPLFAAFAHSIGLSYLAVLTAFHSAACVFFTSQVRFLFRRRAVLLILLIVLLFDPGSFAWRSFQIFYRNTLAVPQVLFIFGAVFGLWLDYGSHRWKDIVRAVIAGFMVWAFWNTREDAIWILPFLLVGLVLVIGKAGVRFRQNRKVRQLAVGLVVAVLPFLILFAGNGWICQQNEKYYGVPVRLEAENGAFAKALKALYSVKNKEDLQYVSVSREKLKRLYKVSPTLKSIKKKFNKSLKFYAEGGRYRHRGETEDGWFLWALRDSAFDAGKAETLTEAQEFYGKIAAEIETALEEGKLERQNTMPSALMSPWRKGYAVEMLKTFPYAAKSVLFFDGTEALPANDREIGEKTIRWYQDVSNAEFVPMGDEKSAAAVSAAAAASRVNRIAKVYQTGAPIAGFAALALFFTMLVYCIRKKKAEHLPYFLVIFGMGLSVMVMLTGIVYTDITAFPAIRHTYLAGAYPLALACIVITILYWTERDGARGRKGLSPLALSIFSEKGYNNPGPAQPDRENPPEPAPCRQDSRRRPH